MAVSIDKTMTPAPLGLDAAVDTMLQADEVPQDIEIEIEVEDKDGEIYVDGEPTGMPTTEAMPHDGNLVSVLDAQEAHRIVEDIIQDVQASSNAREKWVKTYKRGLELLGLSEEKRTKPWDGACGVFHPIMMEAVYNFQATTYADTFPPSGPAKAKVLGSQTPQKVEAATRVVGDMNTFMTVHMREYPTEHSKMLFTLGLAGHAYKKVFYAAEKQRPVSAFVPPEDVIIPYHTTNIFEPEWLAYIAKRSELEVEKLQDSGYLVEASEYPGIEPEYAQTVKDVKRAISGVDDAATTTDDGLMWFIEMYRELKLPGDDRYSPYLVIVDLQNQQMVGLYRNWSEADETRRAKRYFVPYVAVPAFGAMGFGYAHILGAVADANTKLLRQLIDAGTLANLQGGFKTSGLRSKSGTVRLKMGEFVDVDTPSGTKLSDNLLPFAFKEPSQTLLGLMNALNDNGGRLAAITDAKIADVGKNDTPVGTILAVLEQAMKPMSSLQKRVHDSLRDELGLLKQIIRDFAPEDYEYDNDMYTSRKSDYDVIDVIPVSDPGASTMAQKLAQLQFAQTMSQQAPELYDRAELHRRTLSIAGLQDVDKLIPPPKQAQKADPMTENIMVLQGEPIKAFFEQDHEAHIRVHLNFMQDPQLQQLMQSNPNAAQMMASGQAHISEHAAFAYQHKMLKALGVEMPPPGTPLPPEVEQALDQALAQASVKVLDQSKQAIAQQQAAQAAQDPVLQLQQKELEVKQDAINERRERTEAQKQLEVAKIQQNNEKMKRDTELKAARLGVDIADLHEKHRAEGLGLAIKMAQVMAKRVK